MLFNSLAKLWETKGHETQIPIFLTGSLQSVGVFTLTGFKSTILCVYIIHSRTSANFRAEVNF